MTGIDYRSPASVAGQLVFKDRVAESECLIRIGRMGRFHVLVRVEVEGIAPFIRPDGRWARSGDARSAGHAIARAALDARAQSGILSARSDCITDMPTPIEDIVSRLERCEMELHASRGYIKALEYGVHALVARHPDPASLSDLWAHVLAEVSDEQSGMQDRALLYHAAFQQALAVMTEQINGAAERGKD